MKKIMKLMVFLLMLVCFSFAVTGAEENDTIMNLTINGNLNQNVSVAYPIYSNVNGTCGFNSTNCGLHRNITGGGTQLVDSNSNLFVGENISLAVGHYSYTVNSTENTTGRTHRLNITQATGNVTFDISSASDTFGTQVQVNCTTSDNDDGGRVILYRNGTDVTSSENGSFITQSAGITFYNCTNLNSNYTYTSVTFNYTVARATANIELTINTAANNFIQYIPFTTSVFCSVSTQNATLYKDGTKLLSNLTRVNHTDTYSTVGLFNYTCKLELPINYTATDLTYFLNATVADAKKVTGAARTVMVNVLTVILALAAALFIIGPFISKKYETWDTNQWIMFFIFALIYVVMIIILLDAVFTIP